MLTPKLENWLLTHSTLWVAALCCSSFISLSKLYFILQRWGLFLQPTSSFMGHKSCVISSIVYNNDLTCQVEMYSRLSCLHVWFLYRFFYWFSLVITLWVGIWRSFWFQFPTGCESPEFCSILSDHTCHLQDASSISRSQFLWLPESPPSLIQYYKCTMQKYFLPVEVSCRRLHCPVLFFITILFYTSLVTLSLISSLFQ